MIIGQFFVFPLMVIPPCLAFQLIRLSRRPNPPSVKALHFFQSGGLAFVCFGITAILRAIYFREPMGVQFMPIGVGLAVSVGILLFHRMHNEDKRG